jgi:hypothetical protein
MGKNYMLLDMVFFGDSEQLNRHKKQGMRSLRGRSRTTTSSSLLEVPGKTPR